MSFSKAQIVITYLGYFFKKICYQELSKIAQSGHTGQINKKASTSVLCFYIYFLVTISGFALLIRGYQFSISIQII